MDKHEKPHGRKVPGATQDEQLLESPRPDEFTHTDPWRVFRIMGEFVEGFDELASLSRAIAVFGSARTKPDDPDYKAAQETGALFAAQGFAVITGGGPGIMEAANRGAFEAGGLGDLARAPLRAVGLPRAAARSQTMEQVDGDRGAGPRRLPREPESAPRHR